MIEAAGGKPALKKARAGRVDRVVTFLGSRNWLPVVDAFRTLVACPPPVVRAAFLEIQTLAAA